MKKQNHLGQHLKTFTFIKMLGEGAWAKVYEAVDDRDHSTVAVKVIPKQLIRQTPKLDELVKTEIKVLKSCQNENVIRFVDSFKTQSEIFIATQFCNGGDLEKYLDKKKTLPEDEATTFLKQILNGFKGLHQVGAMHRDFKVANVLLHNGVCKIADLGFAKQMQKKDLAKTILGTSLTMAPEVLDEKPYGYEADIWSIGVVYYQLIYGKYPYMGMNDYDILKKIKNNRPDFSRVNISGDAKDFIEKCLTVDPRKRITWTQIYEHPLLNKKQNAFIYGTLKSKISINQNKNFYKKHALPEKGMYPDFRKNEGFDVGGIQFSDVDLIRESSNMNELIEEVNKQRNKEEAFAKYQKFYLLKRNDIMFVFKFIAPYIQYFYQIKANHGIAMFILSKKALIDMRIFMNSLLQRKNIFKLKPLFEEFCASPIYKNIISQIESDLAIIESQSASYSFDIQMCSKAIKDEFDLDKVRSSNFDQLVNQTVEQYWFLLAENLASLKGRSKQDLIKVLEALYYYKQSSKTEVEEFDRMMTVLDYGEAEKDIMKKFSVIYN